MSGPANELRIPRLPVAARTALRVLADAGHEAALVGGSVRDLLLGAGDDPDEWDIATSAHPPEVVALFPGALFENRFGTVTLPGPPRLEITSYRTEGGYRDRRRPDEVRFGVTLAEDLARRDFTINAIAWLPTEFGGSVGRIVDPHGGRDDLAAGLLRAVGDPRERFAEDALRLLRAGRFAGRFGLAVEQHTAAAAGELAALAADVSAERLRDELRRILDAPAPSAGLLVLERLGILRVVLPELAALRGVPQAKRMPGDALDHTLAAVDAAPPGEDPPVRLTALLHDLGKATTLADGHFIGHERVGADLAGALLRRLRFPQAQAARIVHAVRQHMYAYDAGWTDAAVRRFIRRLEPHGRELVFALRRADNVASGVGSAGEANQAALERRIALELGRQPDLLLRNRLAVDGHDLQLALGLRPGPEVGRLLDVLTERVLDDPSLNERERLLRLARETADQR